MQIYCLACVGNGLNRLSCVHGLYSHVWSSLRVLLGAECVTFLQDPGPAVSTDCNTQASAMSHCRIRVTSPVRPVPCPLWGHIVCRGHLLRCVGSCTQSRNWTLSFKRKFETFLCQIWWRNAQICYSFGQISGLWWQHTEHAFSYMSRSHGDSWERHHHCVHSRNQQVLGKTNRLLSFDTTWTA
jgi:hypothetical protein